MLNYSLAVGLSSSVAKPICLASLLIVWTMGPPPPPSSPVVVFACQMAPPYPILASSRNAGEIWSTGHSLLWVCLWVDRGLKLENRSKEPCDFGRDLWIASRAATCAKPHRNPLLEGLRPTLELNTFHHWPGVSCSPLPQGQHQTLLPLHYIL